MDGCVDPAGYEGLSLGQNEGDKVVGTPLEDDIEITTDGSYSQEV